MCQLTFVDLGTINLNRLAISSMGVLNSRVLHMDGVGVFQFHKKIDETSIFKTHLAPVNITNWGNCIQGVISSRDPVFMHVRNATNNGNTNKKIVTTEKSHPFQAKKFVLAHNGTLDMRELSDEEAYKDEELIDSELFVRELSKAYKGIEFKVALVKAMKKFYGKFAFIIFEKKSKEYYIVRGKEKLLHKVNIYEELKEKDEDGEPKRKHIGVIINTEKGDLALGIQTFMQNARWIYNRRLVSGDIELLEEETIFKYDKKELINVGKIEEESKWTGTNTVNKHNHDHSNQGTVVERPVQRTLLKSKEAEKDFSFLLGEELEIYTAEIGFTYRELDQLCYELFEKTLLETQETELDILIHQVLPILADQVSETKLKIWRLTTLASGDWPDKIYQENPEFDYPYMLNPIQVIKELAKKYGVEEKEWPSIVGI